MRLPSKVLTSARFAAGMLAGTLVWWYLTPPYNEVISRLAAPVLRMDARLEGLTPVGAGNHIRLESRSGSFPASNLPASELTWNVILLSGLVATVRRLSGRRRLGRAGLAFAALCATHVLTFVVASEALFATVHELWSPGHYRRWEAEVWLLVSVFLRLVGMLAFPFLGWLYVRSGPPD